MLEVKYFFKDYTSDNMKNAMKQLNQKNIRCKCRGCNVSGRISYPDKVDNDAACTFGPWFDNVLHERGLVVLREDDFIDEWSHGLYENCNANFKIPHFTDDDCHLVERIDFSFMFFKIHDMRWGEVCIGKRLWSIESINNNQWIKQFERVFGASDEPLSSPPTPPASPKMAPQQRPPLPITTTINQGLELTLP